MRGDPVRHAAIRKVDELFRRFVASLCAQFTTPPEELVHRAERNAASAEPGEPQPHTGPGSPKM